MRKGNTLTLKSISLFVFCYCLVSLCAVHTAKAQSGLSSFDRSNAEAMLDAAKDDIKKNYYDPTFRGMDLETRFKEAKEKIKQATTRDQLMAIVAQVLLELNDSHTFFLPPSRAAKVEYGWQMQMIGDNCYITAVKPNTDAEAKGLKQGDLVLSLDGYRPTRSNLWKMFYRYYALAPARMVRFVVQSPNDAQSRQLEILTKIEKTGEVVDWENVYMGYLRVGADLYEDRFYTFEKELMIWKMPDFSVPEKHVDDIMGKANDFKSLIIDMRGNGGGYVKTLDRLIGYFFDKDIKVADIKSRKETKPELAKTRGDKIFKGKLIVLVDSDSGSAAEMFARVIQLEKRGTVLGDRTAGAVMTSRTYTHQTGVSNVLYFGMSITISDVIMTDGKSLEGVGVTPDENLLPSALDIANKQDPVLSKAAALAGVKLEPAKAAEMFPIKWQK